MKIKILNAENQQGVPIKFTNNVRFKSYFFFGENSDSNSELDFAPEQSGKTGTPPQRKDRDCCSNSGQNSLMTLGRQNY
ncbi:hypothetical protein CEXT_470811 [Caerostris extrusa]|uniref:Uncharacterized protein n=1 Tax=Caerostris extrusa TaxID=172846 RepID=A0AAV4WW43_CAEEX|nr:hypothetical protein CEXT_470811 [Caerostris extrusa]